MAEFKYESDDEVRGIKTFDIWRWQAELGMLWAALWDADSDQLAQRVGELRHELEVLVCPDEDA